MPKHTAEQEAVIDSIAAGKSFFCKALAGTGKSYVLKQGTVKLGFGARVLILAFAKVNADEMTAYFDQAGSPVRACTTHSFCYRAGGFRGRSSKFLKMPKPARQLISLRKNTLVDDWQALIDDFGVSIKKEDVKKLDDYWMEDREHRGFNFDDMIYRCVTGGFDIDTTYTHILIDEAQDWNQAQIQLLQMLIEKCPKAAIIAVGDPLQAIYGWRGASGNAVELMTKLCGGAELPLTVNFRCSKSVIRHAQRVVPQIQYHDEAPEGSVSIGPLKPKAGDFVLSRLNAPLVKSALSLLEAGVPALITGSDMLPNLETLFDQYATEDQLDTWFSTVKPTPKNSDLYETAKTILTFNAPPAQTLNRIFGEVGNRSVVEMMSVHKSKGREADNVFILAPECYLHKKGDPDEERNIVYVAYTRAKHNLICTGKEWPI